MRTSLTNLLMLLLRTGGRIGASAALSVVICVVPVHLVAGIDLSSAAYAKSGGGNGGNGGGNGGNSGGGNSGGNSGGGNSGNGNSGNGNGNSGNNGNSNGNGTGGPAPGQGVSSGVEGATHVNETTGDKVTVDGSSIHVQHPDGFSETVTAGRYRMNDALGRTIVDRVARPADVARLRSL
jgi:rRNA maturation protein Nop10